MAHPTNRRGFAQPAALVNKLIWIAILALVGWLLWAAFGPEPPTPAAQLPPDPHSLHTTHTLAPGEPLRLELGHNHVNLVPGQDTGCAAALEGHAVHVFIPEPLYYQQQKVEKERAKAARRHSQWGGLRQTRSRCGGCSKPSSATLGTSSEQQAGSGDLYEVYVECGTGRPVRSYMLTGFKATSASAKLNHPQPQSFDFFVAPTGYELPKKRR